ncbi:uncharacterized protein LOC124169405 [Ischnura elegans]|uniref:uncharacterized protein LOC124169405 n=1 Tax=Ischnura elegans TaxID=197161 RepID=UPI001ED8B9D5|nr:uncharacterized protein LOC124169405 [Ischnura elegans]
MAELGDIGGRYEPAEYDVTDPKKKKIARLYEMHYCNGKAMPEIQSGRCVEELKEELETLGFEVGHKINLDENSLRKDLLSIAKGTEELACLWVFVFAITTEQLIHCYMGAITLEELWAPFTSDKCKILLGKPKMFFVQADIMDKDEDKERPAVLFNRIQPEGGKKISTSPVSADFLIAQFYRHGPGDLSMGRVISEELRKSDPQRITAMLTSIHRRRWRDAPRFSTTFRKKLLLPPRRRSIDTEPRNTDDTSEERYASRRLMAYSFVFGDFQKHLSLEKLLHATEDKVVIKKAMKELGFPYEDCNKNWTLMAHEMRKKLEEIAENKEKADGVMIFISTHGEHDHIYAYDKLIKFSDLLSPFNESESLKGKPKIFFIDACRGNEVEKTYNEEIREPKTAHNGTKPGRNGDDGEATSKSSSGMERVMPDAEPAGPSQEKTSTDETSRGSDMLIGQSSVDCKMAFQASSTGSLCGSLYTQHLCEKFAEGGTDFNLLDLMITTNDFISRQFQECTNQKSQCQMPTFTSSLRKKIVLH